MGKQRKKKTVKPRRVRGRGKVSAPLGSLRVERLAIAKLKPAAYNPRVDLQPGDPEWERIKRSIEKFGYADGIVWNVRSGLVIGGHQRLKVLVAEFGVKELDVQVVDLSPTDERGLNLALNKISGDWEVEALTKLLEELDQSKSFDATVTGFDAAEIDELIDKATGTAGDQAAEVDAHPGRFAVAVVCDSRRQRDRVLRELRAAGHEVVSCAYEAVVRGARE